MGFLKKNELDKEEFDQYNLFWAPVDETIFEDYYDQIKNPMDISTMKNKIQSDEYWDVDRDLRQDVRLMFSNCIEYNSEVPDILDYCEKFEKYANEILDKTEQTMRQKYRAQVKKKEKKGGRVFFGPPLKKKKKKKKKS